MNDNEPKTSPATNPAGIEEELQSLIKRVEQLEKDKKELLDIIEPYSKKTPPADSLSLKEGVAIIKSLRDRKDYLKMLLLMTRRVVGAEGVSILLWDPKSDELYFEEAVGEKAEEVKKFRFPAHEGIAGFSFTTGAALAVADVTTDPRFKREIAEAIGQKQKALMASPLIYNQEIIGVIEAVNKPQGDIFSQEDLEILSSIANFSSFMVRRYDEGLFREDGESLKLAEMVEEICSFGEEETRLITHSLESLRNYLRRKNPIMRS